MSRILALVTFMTTQAIVERGMLDSIGTMVTRVRYVIESRLGEGTTKWLLIGGLVLAMVWALRRRR
jgi:hypothetical protein